MQTAHAMNPLDPIEIHITELAAVTGGLRANADERSLVIGGLRKRYPNKAIVLWNADSSPSIRNGISFVNGGFFANMKRGTFRGQVDRVHKHLDELSTELEH